ncbi:MAG: nucleotide exchange factor GrpE [Coriobacteriia bacterium]|nr:nucleotide exchange factor GrpE [Coriobacteriia bacterium]
MAEKRKKAARGIAPGHGRYEEGVSSDGGVDASSSAAAVGAGAAGADAPPGAGTGVGVDAPSGETASADADAGASTTASADTDVSADDLRKEAEQWRDKALRAQAEFENARRRLEMRHADALLRAGERVITELLPVFDDLERAAEHIGGHSMDHAEGVIQVYRKLIGVLEKEGAFLIDPFGEPFDPAKHSAVQMRDAADVPDGTVVEVLQKGCEMGGRVLRPATVIVSTGGPKGTG